MVIQFSSLLRAIATIVASATLGLAATTGRRRLVRSMKKNGMVVSLSVTSPQEHIALNFLQAFARGIMNIGMEIIISEDSATSVYLSVPSAHSHRNTT